MATDIAQRENQQVRRSVHDSRMIAKIFAAIYESPETNASVDPAKIAENCLGLPKYVQRAKLGCLLRGIDINVSADLALIDNLPRLDRQLTGNEKQFPFLYPGQVIRHAWLGHR
jgi:hypothetical protein